MNEGLLRQRRNLFIACVLLWFLRYGGAQLKKFSLAGFELELANPSVLPLSIWIAFAYFFYRYYQYFTDEGLSKLQSKLAKRLNERCQTKMRAIVFARYPKTYDEGSFRYDILKNNKWIFRGQQVLPDPATGVNKGVPFELPISRWELRRGIVVALLECTFRDSVVSDYLLPFALAGYVLWYCGSSDWSGSFINLIL